MGVGAVIGAIVGGATFAAGYSFFGASIGASMLMGASLGHSFDQRNRSLGVESPTYSFGEIQNTARRDLPVPIIYGRVRVAGNVIDHSQGNGWTSNLTDPGGQGTTALAVRVSMRCKYRTNQGFPGGVNVTWKYRVRYRAAGASDWTETSYTQTVDGGSSPPVSPSERERTAEYNHSFTVPAGNYHVQVIYDEVSLDNGNWAVQTHRLRVETWSHTTDGSTVTQNVKQNLMAGGGATRLNVAVGLGEGEVNSISDIRANDIPIQDIEGAQWSVYHGTADQDYDSKVISGERFKHTAYIAASFEANEQITSVPTITAIVEGLKVPVWDAEEEEWVTEFTRNPAWCLLDFLRNTRYGVGIPDDRIDFASFISEAEYCDELVADGNGGTEPRFCLDYVIDMQRSSLDVIDEILATFRAFLVYSEGRIRLQIERSQPVVYGFTMDNIVADSFVYSKASYKDIPNQIRVEWIDPDGEWQRTDATYDNEIDQDKRGETYSRTISLLGVTRPGQAGRMARFYHDSAFWANTFCEFRVGIDALHVEVGDVVKVSHDVPGWNEKLFRVLEIAEEETDEATLRCREYVSAIYHDRGSVYQLGSETVLPSPLAAPPHVTGVAVAKTSHTLGDGTIVPILRVTWTEPEDLFYFRARVYYRIDGGAWTFAGSSEVPTFDIELTGPGTYDVLVQAENRNRVRALFDTAPTDTIQMSAETPADVTGLSADFTSADAVVTWAPVAHAYRYRVRILDPATDQVKRTVEVAGTSYTYTYAQNVSDFGGSGSPQIKVSVEARNEYGNYSATPTVVSATNLKPAAPAVERESSLTQVRWAVKSALPADYKELSIQVGSYSLTTPATSGVVDLREAEIEDGEEKNITVKLVDVFGQESDPATVQITGRYATEQDLAGAVFEVEYLSEEFPEEADPSVLYDNDPSTGIEFDQAPTITVRHPREERFGMVNLHVSDEVDGYVQVRRHGAETWTNAIGTPSSPYTFAEGDNVIAFTGNKFLLAQEVRIILLSPVKVNEFTPSVYLIANHILGGTLRLTGNMAIESAGGKSRITPTLWEHRGPNDELLFLLQGGDAFFAGALAAKIVRYENLDIAFAQVNDTPSPDGTFTIEQVATNAADWNVIKSSNFLATTGKKTFYLVHQSLDELWGGYTLQVKAEDDLEEEWRTIGYRQFTGNDTFNIGSSVLVDIGHHMITTSFVDFTVEVKQANSNAEFWVRFKRHAIS